MSDISTTLSLNGPLFTQGEILTCSIFNMKIFILIITILICISIIMSSLTSLFANEPEMGPSRYRCGPEHFSNDEFYSYKDTFNKNYSNYQSTSLTSKTNNLIFGQANRYVFMNKESKPIYRLDIFANLYVLNGNPFGLDKLQIDERLEQQYQVHLKETKSGKRLFIGKLKLDNDGLYKFKFDSDTPNEFITFNEVEIVYKTPEKEVVALNGKFSIV